MEGMLGCWSQVKKDSHMDIHCSQVCKTRVTLDCFKPPCPFHSKGFEIRSTLTLTQVRLAQENEDDDYTGSIAKKVDFVNLLKSGGSEKSCMSSILTCSIFPHVPKWQGVMR